MTSSNSNPSRKHRLALHLGEIPYHPFLEPEEILFDGEFGEELNGGGTLDNRSKPGVDGLCLLIIHTYLQRSRNPGFHPEKNPIPEKYRPALKALWDSKDLKNPREWQLKIFGEDPFSDATRYLVRKGSRNGKFNIWLGENVEVDLVHGDPHKTIKSEYLEQLIEHLVKHAGNEPNRLTVGVETDSNVISSAVCEGSLTRTSKFSLNIKWNYKANICVFWVDSEHGVHEFCPALKVNGMDEDNISLTHKKKDSELTVPELDQMEVATQPGLESCIVFTYGETFSREIVNRLTSLLQKSAVNGKRDTTVTKPRFRHFPLPKPSPLRRRVRAVAQPDNWEQLVVSKSMGLADEVYFFQIPNR